VPDLPLDPEVAAALGGSRLIGEELRGDLAAARSAADRALESAHGNAEVARAKAQAGAIMLLQGEPSTALAAFADSLLAERDGPVSEAARALAAFALYSDRFLLADGAEADAMPLMIRFFQQAEELGAPDPGYLGALATARRKVSDGPADQAEAALEALRAATPPGEAFAVLAAADLSRRAGRDDDAERLWDQAREHYAEADDRAGVALCELTHADWWLATPPASGATWGVVLRELGPGTTPAAPPDPPEDLEGARAALHRARSEFEGASAPRGIAAVALRESYVATLDGDPRAARAAADEARDRFAAAGDRAGARLSEAHGCLADVDGDRPAPLETARAIGAWGREGGSFAFACGIGLQFAGAAERWRGEGRLDAALSALELASALSEGLVEGFGAIDALAARAAIHDDAGEAVTAADLLDEASVIADALLALVPVDLRVPLTMRAADGTESLRALLHTLGDADRLERLIPRTASMGAAVVEWARANKPEAAPELEREYARAVLADTVTAHVYRAWWALERDKAPIYERELEAARASAAGDRDGGPWLEMLVHLAAEELAAAREAFGRLRAENATDLRRELTYAVTVEDWSAARESLDALGEGWAEREAEPWQGLAETAQVLEAERAWPAALERYDAALADVAGRQPPVGRGAQRVEEAAPFGAASTVAAHAARALLGASAAGAGPAEDLERRAFAALEDRKARGLLALATSGAAAAALRGTAAPEARRWRELTARAGTASERLAHAESPDEVAAARAELESCRRALAELEAELRAQGSPWLDVLSPRIAPPTLPELCAALPADTAMLHYTIAAGELIAMAVTRSGVAATHRAPCATRRLAADIARFRVLCAAGESDRWRKRGRELFDLLLGPFARVLDEHEHLWISPSAAAHGLPFAALLRGEEPLVTTHTTTLLPSAGLGLLLEREPDPLDGPALVVGDPEAMAWPGSENAHQDIALPWAGAEAAASAQRLGVDPLLGPAATEAAVRARLAEGQLGLAFLATHGRFEDPALTSVLLLADGARLSVFELLGMGLDVELMVLSACESGRSVVRAGDELQGFPAAVLAAGVRGVLATLWEVSDGGTAILMRDFIGRLAAGERPRSALAGAQRRLRTLKPAEVADEVAALREAAANAGRPLREGVKDPRDDLSHPYYWASFALFGR
jgi:CHAT domain-containing protein